MSSPRLGFYLMITIISVKISPKSTTWTSFRYTQPGKLVLCLETSNLAGQGVRCAEPLSVFQ